VGDLLFVFPPIFATWAKDINALHDYCGVFELLEEAGFGFS
jgi:hypothetical protein